MNEQAGLAVATAESGDVSVEQAGPLSAGLDGITASSEAIAKTDLEQEAKQKNEDSKDITRPEEDGSGEDQVETFQPVTIAAQLEGVLQANANLQFGLAVASAQSGDVDVTSLGDISAGEDGIVAESKAVAITDFDQKARQKNDNDVAADGAAAVLQGQLVGQINFNVQGGAAVADAESGDVDVEQQGGVLEAGLGGVEGDGINAESKAVAVANLDQDARQRNENSADAELGAPDTPVQVGTVEVPNIVTNGEITSIEGH